MGRRLGANEAKRRLDASERQAKAVELYIQGLSFRAIATELGYAGPSGVKKAIDGAIAKAPSRAVDELRVEVEERSRVLLAELMPMVLNKRLDREARLQAMDRVLKIDKELRKLHGLDAPTTVHFDVSGLSEDELCKISGIAPGEPLALAESDAAEEGDRRAPTPVGGEDEAPVEGEPGSREGAAPGSGDGEEGSALA